MGVLKSTLGLFVMSLNVPVYLNLNYTDTFIECIVNVIRQIRTKKKHNTYNVGEF